MNTVGWLWPSHIGCQNAFLPIAIFALTLFLMLKKPWRLHESWSTVGGALLMLLVGAVSPQQAFTVVSEGADVLFFLFALMLLSVLLDRAGFFEWCALHAARSAGGDVRKLYRNVFLVGAAITAFLSLDTTAIILTPIVVSFVQKLNLKAHPFLIACAFVSNTGSLLLPVSNLTNLLFQHAFDLTFSSFFLYMLAPQIVAVGINYALFVLLFGKDLPNSYNQNLPEPASAIRNQAFFKVSIIVLILVLVGYFVGAILGVKPYFIALSGCGILLAAGFKLKQHKLSDLSRQISWELFPFVIGLFVLIRGLENLGLAKIVASSLNFFGQNVLSQILATAFITGLGSNIVNNVPMALLSISALREAHTFGGAGAFAALIGCNIGPNLTILGSLATMLVISSARKKGEDISALEFLKIGIVVTPIILTTSSLALVLSLSIFGGASK